MYISTTELRDKAALLRKRMLNHQVVNDTAVVVLSAQELDELLSYIEAQLETD